MLKQSLFRLCYEREAHCTLTQASLCELQLADPLGARKTDTHHTSHTSHKLLVKLYNQTNTHSHTHTLVQHNKCSALLTQAAPPASHQSRTTQIPRLKPATLATHAQRVELSHQNRTTLFPRLTPAALATHVQGVELSHQNSTTLIPRLTPATPEARAGG